MLYRPFKREWREVVLLQSQVIHREVCTTVLPANSKGTLLIRGFLEARKHMERIVLQAAQLSHFSPVKIFTGTLCLFKKINSYCFA